jgi:hypothetical protein
MRRLLLLAALIAALCIVAVAGARPQGGYSAYQCNVNCSINVYQYGDGAYRNVWNGCCHSQQFYAPYSTAVTGYAHWNGRTLSRSISQPGGLLLYSF